MVKRMDRIARVILLAGPSGSGKSTLARRSGLPLLELDHFYFDGDRPDLPRREDIGLVDWDDIATWDAEGAMAALLELCTTGRTQVPVYDIGQDRRVGTVPFSLDGADRFIAEGIFAADLVPHCRAAGILADAIAVKRSRWKNVARRVVRDLKEQRKKPLDVARRSRVLLAEEPAVMARFERLGCRPLNAKQTLAALRGEL